MICGECGAIAPDGAVACASCGATVILASTAGARARGGLSRTTIVVVVAAGMTLLAIIVGLIVIVRAIATW